MTDKAVPISITINAGSKAEVIQKDLSIPEMEQMISSLWQEVSVRTIMVILSELDEELRSRVPGSWKIVGRDLNLTQGNGLDYLGALIGYMIL